MKYLLSRVGRGISDVIAPSRCIRCLQEGSWLCGLCRQHAVRHPNLSCIVCAEKHARGYTCRDCKPETALYGAVHVGQYSTPYIRRGIHWFKFKGVRSACSPLAGLLVARISAIAPIEYLAVHAVIVPIPLHARRLRKRGFNQSMDIAQIVSRFTSIPIADVLVRNKATLPQARLPHDLRAQNISNAFSSHAGAYSPELLMRKYILIIDDVTTTGTTISSAAEALGAKEDQQVWSVTIARG